MGEAGLLLIEVLRRHGLPIFARYFGRLSAIQDATNTNAHATSYKALIILPTPFRHRANFEE